MLIDIFSLSTPLSKSVKTSLNMRFIDKYRELIALSHISQNVSSSPGGNITDFSKRAAPSVRLAPPVSMALILAGHASGG
jgi:hypothetical protein